VQIKLRVIRERVYCYTVLLSYIYEVSEVQDKHPWPENFGLLTYLLTYVRYIDHRNWALTRLHRPVMFYNMEGQGQSRQAIGLPSSLWFCNFSQQFPVPGSM